MNSGFFSRSVDMEAYTSVECSRMMEAERNGFMLKLLTECRDVEDTEALGSVVHRCGMQWKNAMEYISHLRDLSRNFSKHPMSVGRCVQRVLEDMGL